MKNADLFDQHAGRYEEEVDAAISASGYSAGFFADLKAELVAAAVEEPWAREVLDFGCGVGNTTRALGRELPESSVTGVDVSPESIEKAERIEVPQEVRTTYTLVDENGLPFADDRFDLAFASCVFHHIEREDHDFWAREILRVLRPGGRFFLFEHNPYNPLTRRVVNTCPFDEGVTLLSARYARRLLGSSGFTPSAPYYYFFFPRFLGRLRGLEPRLSWLPLGAQYYVAGQIPE